MTELLTTGQLARRLGVPRTRLDYALDRAGIQERGRAGIIRLFSPEQIHVIRAALGNVRPQSRTKHQAEEDPDQ